MKKKFKLFATISSLCLAVALMAFGVYAATQVSYTVSNNIVYDIAAEAKVDIAVKTYKLTDPTLFTGTAPASAAAAEGLGFATTVTGDANTSTYTGTGAAARYNDKYTDNGSLTYDLDGLTDGSYCWKIVVSIHSIETAAQTVSIANNINNAGIWKVTGTDVTTVAANGDATYTFYIGLKDATQPIQDTAVGTLIIAVGTAA